MTAAELRRVPFKATSDRMITLGELCDLVAGRTVLVIELKSRFDGDLGVVARAAEVLAGYRGPAALMSFDPAQIAAVREIAPQLPRGMVAESPTSSADRGQAFDAAKEAVAYLRADPVTPVRNSSPIRSATCPRRCRRLRARCSACRC